MKWLAPGWLAASAALIAGCAPAPAKEGCKDLEAFNPGTASVGAAAAFRTGKAKYLGIQSPGGVLAPGVGAPTRPVVVIANADQETACAEAYYRAYAYALRFNEALLSEDALRRLPPAP